MSGDTEFPVAQSRVDREPGRGVGGRTFGRVFVFGLSVGATETCRASVSLLLGVQLVLKMSGTEVLVRSTPDVGMGRDEVVSKGLSALTLVLASVSSPDA